MTPDPPAIAGYRLIRELGRGGMATVYLAVQASLEREVALKVLAPALAADPVAAERFLREGRIAARLVHRHIVGIHDVGVFAGLPYLAMEFVPGGTVPADTPMPVARALAVVREIALALDHAHSQGVIHRDIKPENILVRADGSHALSDFGIARAMDAGSNLTAEGIAVGTPYYMSPEQLQAQALDGRADLYSLGVVLFQLLTGRLPFRGTDGVPVGMQQVHAPHPPLPEGLSRYQSLLDALLAKSPAQRPASAAALVARIEALDGTPQGVATLPLPAISAHSGLAVRASRRLIRPIAALLAVSALVVAIVFTWPDPSVGKPQAEASSNSASTALTAATTPDKARSIAVMPLLNIGGQAEQEYFSDGLAESLRDMLARVPDLKVIARTSSFAFKGQAVDAREIGRALEVAHLLEGSVQHADQKVRITVQLVRTQDGTHVWSQRYDRDLADVFAIQDEISQEVLTKLLGTLPQAPHTRMSGDGTANVAAYQQYLQGNALLPGRQVDELRRAQRHFERAIELDPGYARAYVALATALDLLSGYAGDSVEASVTQQRRHIEQALVLAPDLGEAHIALAHILAGASDWNGAEAAFKRGTQLAPGYASGAQWYGQYQASVRGDPQAGITWLQRASVLDPRSPGVAIYARMLWELGEHAAAAQQFARVLQNAPNAPFTHWIRASYLLAQGDLTAALEAQNRAIALDPSSALMATAKCSFLLDAGAIADTSDCVAEVTARFGESAESHALRAQLAWLETGMERALTIIDQLPGQNEWDRAWLHTWTGRSDAALDFYRRMRPQLTAPIIDHPVLAQAKLHVRIGDALKASGATAQAMALWRYALSVVPSRPNLGGFFGQQYDEVLLHARLGDLPAACASLARLADAGHVHRHWELRIDPALTALRADPCFAPAYAALEAKAQDRAAQARQAGVIATANSTARRKSQVEQDLIDFAGPHASTAVCPGVAYQKRHQGFAEPARRLLSVAREVDSADFSRWL